MKKSSVLAHHKGVHVDVKLALVGGVDTAVSSGQKLQ